MKSLKLWLARTFLQDEAERILDAKADAEQWHPGASFVLDLEALGLKQCIVPTCKKHMRIKLDTCPRCHVFQEDNNLPPLKPQPKPTVQLAQPQPKAVHPNTDPLVLAPDISHLPTRRMTAVRPVDKEETRLLSVRDYAMLAKMKKYVEE